MKYTEYVFQNQSLNDLKTEALFEIATERAKGSELIKFMLTSSDEVALLKQKNGMMRFMKTLKDKGIVQFYAFSEAFDENSTEAMFLSNKYPEVFSKVPTEESGGFFVFVRI